MSTKVAFSCGLSPHATLLACRFELLVAYILDLLGAARGVVGGAFDDDEDRRHVTPDELKVLHATVVPLAMAGSFDIKTLIADFEKRLEEEGRSLLRL